MSGRPCDLKIISSGHCIQIQYFPCEIKTLHLSGLHGGGIHILYADAASGDNGLRKSSGAGHRQFQMLDDLYKICTLCLRDLMHFLLRRDPGQFDHHRNQPIGKQLRQCIFKLFLVIGIKFTQQALVQLFFGKGRLQINGKTAVCSLPIKGAGRQNQRTADSEMGKQHLSKPFIDLALGQSHGQRDIFQ